MPLQKSFFLLLLLCLMGTYSLSAQKIGYHQYSLEDGLSEAEVRDIIQAQDGMMWVATRYGLNRFDGLNFANYYTEDGLVDNKIQCLMQDRSGKIWIGTSNGLSVYDGQRFYSPAGFRSLENKTINTLFEDIEGHIWVGTDGFGAYRWHPDQAELIQFTTETGLSNDRVRDILQSREGIIWIATRNGLNGYFNDRFRHYYIEDGLPDNKIRALHMGINNELLIGTRSGLAIFENEQFLNFGPKNGLYTDKITDIGTTSTGKIWLATEDGIASVEEDYIRIYNLLDGLPVNIYETLWIDDHDQPWMGSFGSGLIKLIGESVIRYDAEFPFPERVIRSLAVKDKRNLWVGTYGGGLVRLGDDNAVQSYRMFNGLTDDKVYSLLAEGDGVWVGTQGGLDYLDANGFQNFYGNPLPFRKVRDIERVGQDLWLATNSDGLIRFNPKEKNYTQFLADLGDLPSNTVEQVVKDQDNQLWVGTYSGLVKLNPESLQKTFYSIEDGLPNNAITHLSVDRQNVIWATTYKGFARIKDENVFAFDELSGLPGNLCFFIEQDKWDDAIYWIGTNAGLVRFDQEAFFNGEPAFMVFTEEYGLLSGEFNEAAIQWFGNRLFVGTVNGMMSIDTRSLQPEQKPSRVSLNRTLVLNQPIENFKRKDLRYDQNFLQFDFTGIDFVAPSQLKYEYRLLPVEESYTTTTDRRVRYSALPPGDYWFEVLALNNSGLRSEEPARLHFVIKPPFWQQWWFILLILIALGGVFAFIYNYFRINRLIDIERMRVRIASDLHDDVGATLTEIALNSDFLMATQQGKEVEPSLKEIGSLARNVVSSLDDIVWSIDARNDTAGDLGDRIQDTAGQIFRNLQTQIHFDFDANKNDRALPVEVRENVFLIVKEALNNAAKYANADNIRVKIAFKRGKLLVEVKDDGIGLHQHQSGRKGNGLLNMKMRAERIHANLHIEEDNGTLVRISDIRI